MPAYLALSCCDELPRSGEGVALLDADGALLAGDGSAPGDRIRGQKGRRIADGWLMLPVPCRSAPWRSAAGMWAAPPFRPCLAWGFPARCSTVGRSSRTPANPTARSRRSWGTTAISPPLLTLDERDYVLIMTHSHRHDFAVLEQVLRQPLAYGGSWARGARSPRRAKRHAGSGISESALDAVHMPIGLDIKAETPEEIAVSIAAECILHRATR